MTNGFELAPMKAFLKHRKEFFVIDDAKQYKRVTVRLHAQGVVLRDEIYGSQLRTKKQQAIKAGDLLVAEIDAKVGGVGVVPLELAGAIVSSHYYLYEIDEKVCHPRFLEYYIRSGAVEQQFQEVVRGSTNYASIRSHHTPELQIPLPPLDEQRRIVARIEELAALIEEAQALRAEAREEAEALLSSELDRRFDRSKDSELPPRWNWFTLGDLLIRGKDGIRTGPFGTLLSKSDFRARGVPLIGIACVDRDKFHPDRCDYISERKADALTRYRLVNGDAIVARSGTVGRCCIVRNVGGLAIMSSNLMRLRFNTDECDLSLVCQLLNSSALIHKQIDEMCRGTTRTFFNQQILTSMEIPLPDVHDQHRIVAHLDDLQDQVDELTALQEATQVELGALLPSVLDRAFRGEL
ncbi:MAG: restriction endonuclease subunit S [Anaerolineae bacterium]|nr:restriction endonuclease subunit S [Anaerolineae bacterium]